MRRGGLDALFFSLFFWNLLCRSIRQKIKKTFVILLSHDAAPHFETLPHRNLQQTFREAP